MESLLVGDEQLCLECGMSHRPERRQTALKRLLPAEKEALQAIHPCWWGQEEEVWTTPGSRRLLLDLKAINARFDSVKQSTRTKEVIWFPPEYNIAN